MRNRLPGWIKRVRSVWVGLVFLWSGTSPQTARGQVEITLDRQPGVVAAWVWYPAAGFHQLGLDADGLVFRDRHLDARGSAAPFGPAILFEQLANGRTRPIQLWWWQSGVVSGQGRYDPTERLLHFATAGPVAGLRTVRRDERSGEIRPFLVDDRQLVVMADGMPSHFALKIVSRAEGELAIDWALDQHGLHWRGSRLRSVGQSRPLTEPARVRGVGSGLAVDGRLVTVTAGGPPLTFRGPDPGLRSWQLTARGNGPDGRTWIGTAGGDLIAVRCSTDQSCHGRSILTRGARPVITGVAMTADQTLVVGTLDGGLQRLHHQELVPWGAAAELGPVTVLAQWRERVLVGTLSMGLWQLSAGELVRWRGPASTITGIAVDGDQLVVDAGPERFFWSEVDAGFQRRRRKDALPSRSPVWVAGVAYEGKVLVGSVADGVYRQDPEGWRRVDLALSPMEQQINAMAVTGDLLWLATEAGLLMLERDICGVGINRVLFGPVRDVVGAGTRVAVAGPRGPCWVTFEDELTVDCLEVASEQVPTSVGWLDGRLVGGNRSGLFVRQADRWTAIAGVFPGGITALVSDRDQLLVGTAERGVWRWDGRNANPVASLAQVSVGPGAMRRIRGDVWMGSRGPSITRLRADGRVSHFAVPVGEVRDFVPGPRGLMLIGTQGIAVLDNAPGVAQQGEGRGPGPVLF